jgi:hypothetical protein
MLALCLAACAGTPPSEPPASLPPARGFLALTPQGIELEYDLPRQTYAVRGRPDTWWLDGRFFRRVGDGWEASPRLEGPWQSCAAEDLPAALGTATLAQ